VGVGDDRDLAGLRYLGDDRGAAGAPFEDVVVHGAVARVRLAAHEPPESRVVVLEGLLPRLEPEDLVHGIERGLLPELLEVVIAGLQEAADVGRDQLDFAGAHFITHEKNLPFGPCGRCEPGVAL